MVTAVKMLCHHDTVIPQPAAAHHDKQEVLSIVSNTSASLSLPLRQGAVCSNSKKCHCVARFMCVSISV